MSIHLVRPENGEIVSLLTKLHKDFFRNGGNKDSSIAEFDYMNLWRQGVDNSFGEPVKFQWDGTTQAQLELSLDKDFTQYASYDADDGHAEIYNLMIGKHTIGESFR